MIPHKLQEVGCTNTNTHTMYRGEIIYIEDGKYYPTICNGYKNAACCNTCSEAKQWIDNIKNA